jgi:four helix bundle protein
LRNFRELEVWNEARALVKDVYLLTKGLPDEEKYGLTSQIRRCVISIPANIAEGSAKDSQKDFSRFLQISLGSSFELESHVLLAVDLGLLPQSDVTEILQNLERLQKKLNSFIKYVSSQF